MKKITLILFMLINFIVYSQDKKYLTDRNEAINLIMIKEYDKALIKINSSLKLKENDADSYYIRGNIFQAKFKIKIHKMTKNDLKPARVFEQFAKINQIPRPSKHEEQMIEYLKEFGKSNN